MLEYGSSYVRLVVSKVFLSFLAVGICVFLCRMIVLPVLCQMIVLLYFPVSRLMGQASSYSPYIVDNYVVTGGGWAFLVEIKMMIPVL